MTAARPEVAFRLLGEFEVLADGVPLALGGAKQRALLAILLLERGRAVSTDRLIDLLWSERQPATAQKSVQVYVSGLRKVLGEGRILTRGRGYELVVEDGETDLDVFDLLVRDGRPGEALALVRGRPLADLALEPWAAPEVAQIEERILAAHEARIRAELEQGHHAELVAELEALVREHPYREGLLELLMLTLYRSGRQAEALDAYRRGATRLRDDLGLEPGRPLRELEASILKQSPELDAPASAGDPATARRRRGWKLATAGAVALVVAGGAAAAIALTRDDSASLESLPAGIAVISATDGSLVAHHSRQQVADPVEAASDGEHFWVTNLNPASLIEIDPRTGRILRSVASPVGNDGMSLPEGRFIWFNSEQDLMRVEVTEGHVVESFPLTDSRTRLGLAEMAHCFGSMWVVDNGDQELLRVDPSTGRIVARIPAQYPWAVECDDRDVWLTSNLVGVHRIDPRRNKIVTTTRTPAPNVTLAVGGGYAWASSEESGEVYKIAHDGRLVATYQTGDGARDLSFAGGKLWVANQDAGTVTGIDPATGDQQTFRFGHPVQMVAALGSKLVVLLNPGLTYEDQIDALKGNVARLIVPTYVFDPIDPALGYSPWMFMVEHATCSTLVSSVPGSRRTVVPDLATAMPAVSADGRMYTFRVRSGVRFAPPSSASVTAHAVRFSIERALSPKLGSEIPGMHFLGDVVGAAAFSLGAAEHVSGIRVSGDTVAITLTKPSRTFLERLALPFFCVVPETTPVVQAGVSENAPPSAGPYYVSKNFNGEFLIMKRNPNYTGPHPARLDAIAFRMGLTSERAVARVRSGRWDGVILPHEMLASSGALAIAAAADSKLRTEELPLRGIAFQQVKGSLQVLMSPRLGCDAVVGDIDLTSLCTRKT